MDIEVLSAAYRLGRLDARCRQVSAKNFWFEAMSATPLHAPLTIAHHTIKGVKAYETFWKFVALRSIRRRQILVPDPPARCRPLDASFARNRKWTSEPGIGQRK